jgi:hypothetical protein
MGDERRYAGMTANEPLFDAGLMDAFDFAAKARNRAEMIRLLMNVGVDDAASSADTILESPKRYGY